VPNVPGRQALLAPGRLKFEERIVSKKERRRLSSSCDAALAHARWLISLPSGRRMLARLLAMRKLLRRGLAGGALAVAMLAAPALANGPFVSDAPLESGRPTFVDIDGDGDQDAFVGQKNGIRYFRNNGTPTSADFDNQTGVTNPLPAPPGFGPALTFVDIDGDGDQDAFVVSSVVAPPPIFTTTNVITYYRNNGTATAPDFADQTGVTSPLATYNASTSSAPTFADIDDDGDQDAFIGTTIGTVDFVRNNGTVNAPDFADQTGVTNPLAGVNVSPGSATPVFGDIDNDGDLDAFVGAGDGTIKFFRNNGTASAPSFAEQTGVANPLAAVDLLSSSSPALVDIDADGDLDAFVGSKNDVVRYYRNNGTPQAPAFASQVANPLIDVSGLSAATPAFADIDNDDDQDAFVGIFDGTIKYVRNNGTPSAPDFAAQTGVTNPLAGVDVGDGAAPTVADIDNDGDLDLIVGALV
jgi:hypothetical protein